MFIFTGEFAMGTRNQAYTIAIEGSDGAGKETQTTLLSNHFVAQGKRVARVSFPRYGKTCGGKLLFEAFKSERSSNYNFASVPAKAASLIYAADRLESLPFLRELVANNDIVIFDRYVESNLLHQGGKLPKPERKAFAKWLYTLEYEMNGLPKPDIVVYLSVPYEVSIARARVRAELKNEKPDALEKNEEYVRQGNAAGMFYADLLHWRIVNCVQRSRGRLQHELTTDEVHQEIVRLLAKR